VSAPISIQLYTLREALEADLNATFHRLSALGITQVEPFRFPERSAEIGAALTAHGLSAPTVHGRLLTEGVDVDAVLDAAAAVGAQTVIDPFIDATRWSTAEGVRAIADQFNALAPRAADRGLLLGYHNHWWETEYRIDGLPALELLTCDLDPAIRLEIDLYWALVGGVDPVGLLERLGDRVTALHVKDGLLAKDGSGQSALGTGVVPVLDCLRAAPTARRVLELDHFDGDVWEPIAAGLDFVRQADER
jgi:sugar phosphate isomerase/epimerase